MTTTRAELFRTLRWAFGLSSGVYVALTILATIDPLWVRPFIEPGWFLGLAVILGSVMAWQRTTGGVEASQPPRRLWFALGFGLVLGLALWPGLSRDGLPWYTAVGAGLLAAWLWWLCDRSVKAVNR